MPTSGEWAQTDLFAYCRSASLSQTPRSFAYVPGMFAAPNKLSAFLCLIVKIRKHALITPHALKPAIYTEGMSGQHIQRASDSSRWLYFEGLGIGQGRLTWQSYPLGPE